MISPKMFRKFIKPSLQCFIDMGLNILNPIQVSAKDMEPAGLKRDSGYDLCFHGALDFQTVLSQGTPDQVCDEVERLVDILGSGGGFILAPTHNVMPGACRECRGAG